MRQTYTHGFKRTQKQIETYNYIKEKIENNEPFTIKDIADDLYFAQSTANELVQELSEQGKIIHGRRGYIGIQGLGDNGREYVGPFKITKNNQRKEKSEEIYKLICKMAKEGMETISLSQLYTYGKFKNKMHVTTLRELLILLHNEKKICYHKGKITDIVIQDVEINDKEEEIKENTDVVCDKEITNEPFKSNEYKYDLAVKRLIADYITNSNITTKDEIINYIDAITSITDKLKTKLFE